MTRRSRSRPNVPSRRGLSQTKRTKPRPWVSYEEALFQALSDCEEARALSQGSVCEEDDEAVLRLALRQVQKARRLAK